MSRLAKKAIKLPEGVSFSDEGDFWVFKSSKGENKVSRVAGISLRRVGEAVFVESAKELMGRKKALLGTAWALVRNAIRGALEGFSKTLEVEGVGYKALIEGEELVLHLGYAVPVRLSLPAGVKVEVEKNTIKISGVSKELVGSVAANIRELKKPEPYKGKGIRYKGESIRRKAGKKAGATAGAA